MARNTGNNYRNGAVKERSQVQSFFGNWLKRDAKTGRFMSGKEDGSSYKGIRREK